MTNLWIETHDGSLVNLAHMSNIKVAESYGRDGHDDHGLFAHLVKVNIRNDLSLLYGTKAECEVGRDAIRKIIETKTAAFVPSITELVAEIEKTKE